MASASGSPSTRFDAHWDHGDPPTVYLTGEVDLTTHDRLAAVLDQAATPRPRPRPRLHTAHLHRRSRDPHRGPGREGDRRRTVQLTGVHGTVAMIIDVLDLAGIVPNLRQDTT